MKTSTSMGLLRWLAGWLAGHRFRPLYGLVASGHSEFACRWHVHSTADTWNKISASSVLVGARTHIELTWPNGPMVAVGHVHHNNKSIHTAIQDNSRRVAHTLPDFDGKCARMGMASCHITVISPSNTVGHIASYVVPNATMRRLRSRSQNGAERRQPL